MMDLIHLRSFVEVAERGTVAAAAQAQGYTAPAVSQHLAKLESNLDAALFDRVGGRLSLTGTGRRLLPLAVEMLDLDVRCRRVAAAAQPLRALTLSGFASAIATVVIPHLDQLRAIADIEIVEAEDADALRDLGLGSVDLVLTQEYAGHDSPRNRRLHYTAVHRDALALIVPPHMAPTTTLDDVSDEPWLVNGAGTRCTAATMDVLAAAQISPHIAGVVADNSALVGLVAAGAGVTVVPASVVDPVRGSVTVAEVDLGVARTIYAVTRRAVGDALEPVIDILATGQR